MCRPRLTSTLVHAPLVPKKRSRLVASAHATHSSHLLCYPHVPGHQHGPIKSLSPAPSHLHHNATFPNSPASCFTRMESFSEPSVSVASLAEPSIRQLSPLGARVYLSPRASAFKPCRQFGQLDTPALSLCYIGSRRRWATRISPLEVCSLLTPPAALSTLSNGKACKVRPQIIPFLPPVTVQEDLPLCPVYHPLVLPLFYSPLYHDLFTLLAVAEPSATVPPLDLTPPKPTHASCHTQNTTTPSFPVPAIPGLFCFCFPGGVILSHRGQCCVLKCGTLKDHPGFAS